MQNPLFAVRTRMFANRQTDRNLARKVVASKQKDHIMLHSAKQKEGYAINATDGVKGHVEDFYLDHEKWVIRNLIVDTGGWLSSRKVLVSPPDINANSKSSRRRLATPHTRRNELNRRLAWRVKGDAARRYPRPRTPGMSVTSIRHASRSNREGESSLTGNQPACERVPQGGRRARRMNSTTVNKRSYA